MNIRLSRVAMGLLVLAAVVLTAKHCWAVRYGLGPSKDEWKLKYNVAVQDDGGDKLTVVFTLADEGRLKPIYSADLVAFSKQTDAQGGRTYDVNVPIQLKPTKDGKREGQVQMRKEFLDRAMIRIITLTFDGKKQPSTGAYYYDIPIVKYLSKAPGDSSTAGAPTAPPAPPAPPAVATPPGTKVTR